MKLYRAGESRRRDWQLINRRQETRLGREPAKGLGPDQAEFGGRHRLSVQQSLLLLRIYFGLFQIYSLMSGKLHNTQHSYCVIFFVKIFISLWVSLKILQANFPFVVSYKSVSCVGCVAWARGESVSLAAPLFSYSYTECFLSAVLLPRDN